MDYLNKLFKIENKVVVITGGAGAIATKIAEGFLKSGAKVALLDLDLSKANLVTEKLSKFGKTKAYKSNVLDQECLEQNRAEILKDFGCIDILINAAGGNMAGATINPDQTIFDMDMEQFKKVQDLNLNGSVIPSLVFGKEIANKGKGSIINISSVAASSVLTRVVGYSASKAAITNFTKWLAVEMAQKFGDKIRVNAIAPGFFIGEQNRTLLTNSDGTLTNRGETIINNTPMKRFGELDELIGATLWLCSDAAKFVTGIILPIDGGFTAFSGV